jgi:error-prone DNA polymerase
MTNESNSAMPELSPKAFEKLSRTIGDGLGLQFANKRHKAGENKTTPDRTLSRSLLQFRSSGGGEGRCRSKPAGACALEYAELHATSNFSFLRGASHPWELVEQAAALGLKAIAITDRNSLAGIVRAHQAAQGAGIRLVVGARLDLRDGTGLLAFPEDRAAYGRLTTLLTLGKRRAPKGECHLDYADVAAHGEGLVVALLPPDYVDRLSLIRHRERARLVATDFPGRAYLVAHHLYRGDDARRIVRLGSIAEATGLKLLATGDVLYHTPERRPLQDVVTCIREHCTILGAGFRLAANAERHLKPAVEMARLFRGREAALAASIEIAERCRFSLDELRYEYPEVPVPPSMTPQQRLAQLAWEGAIEKFGCKTDAASFERAAMRPPQNDDLFNWRKGKKPPEAVSRRMQSDRLDAPTAISRIPVQICERIEHELALIEKLDYARYFITVHDIVQFAKRREILCQGRGSAANSVVCYCLGITAVDPEKIDVLFERFISAARGEPPDIDVDFEHERREEVIQYVYQRYGRDHAGLAATLITYRSRGAIREVGKVMGLSGDVVAALSGMVWGWSSERLRDERVREAGLDPADRNLRRALDLAGALIGFPRHLSQHVGGFVITRGPLHQLVPIENAAMADRTVIEWDKDDLDALHILKIDILALGMLTCVRKAFDLLAQHKGKRLDLTTIPGERPEVYDMLSKADSIGVFQVESRAQMSMLPRLKPKEFYDLVIEVAIVRPGPIQGDMVHPYLRRRNGIEEANCPPGLKHILDKTMGVPLFQEQAMQIAIDGAGFTPDEADQLRRSMASFRRNGDIEKFRDKFIGGMTTNGYPRDFAEHCFSQIEGFGTYGFPESHAASFSLLVYVSAWIKCFHPESFACALLNSQPMGFYQPAQIVRDAREHGVVVLPVDVNHSDWDCTLEYCPGDFASFETLPSVAPGDQVLFGWQQGHPPAKPAKPTPRGVHEADPATRAFALRLGLRQIKGFSEADAERLVAGRCQGYESAEALWRRSGLGRLALERLAGADALRSLTLDRRQGIWSLKALGEAPLPLFAVSPSRAIRGSGDLPLRRQAGEGIPARPSVRPSPVDGLTPAATFSRNAAEGNEAHAASLLPPMPLGEQVIEDYASLNLSLKRHPLAFLRDELKEDGIVTAAELATLPVERRVRVAGLVLIRQRPGSAKGVIFITLEDETGVANLIIWPPILERYRRTVLGATLLYCRGRLQREEGVIHVVAGELRDFTPRLKTLRGRDSRGHALNRSPCSSPLNLPERVPGYTTRDFYEPLINVHSRDFR